MLLLDIINSCSNERVAKAALESIGGGFTRRIYRIARDRNMEPGAFAAGCVSHFRDIASPKDIAHVRQAMASRDQPLLIGLRMILERALMDEDTADFYFASFAASVGNRIKMPVAHLH